MAPPKFHQGECVLVPPDGNNSNVRPGIYTITRVMPASFDGIRYRAKNEMETHERVLHEEQLRPVSDAAPLMTVDRLRETAASTSGGEQRHRKRQQYRRDRAVQTHPETGQGSGTRPDFAAADRYGAAPHR